MDKLVSIIMPTYNNAAYLIEAVNSCLNQTYKNIELVIVDDGSTDSTPKLIDYINKKNKNVYIYHKDNGGPSSAMNYAIDKCKGEIICFAASDDIQLPNKVKIIVESLEDVDFCYSGYYHANVYGQAVEEVHPKPLTKENIKNNDCMSGGALAGYKYVFDKIKFRDYQVNEDMSMAWDLFNSHFKYAMIDIPTFRYRLLKTGVSYSKKKDVEKITEEIKKEIDETKN